MKRKLSLFLTMVMILSVMTMGAFSITANAADSTTEYTITYHLDGGTNATKNPEVYTSEDVITLKDATKEGYTFVGWYLDQAKTQKITTISNRSGNLNLYAMFSPNSYTATFNGNGADRLGKIKVTLIDTKYNKSKTVYLEAGDSFNPYDYWTPYVDRYAFIGWTYNYSIIKNSIEINEGSDIEIYAKWSSRSGYVSSGYEYYLSSDQSILSRSFYNDNEACRISWDAFSQKWTSPFSDGREYISSWSISVDGIVIASGSGSSGRRSGSRNINPGSVVTITCGTQNDNAWACINLTFNAKRGNDGEFVVSSDTHIMQQEFNDETNTPIVSKNGYDFKGWYDANGNIITNTWKYTEDQTFTAKWQPTEYSITYNLDGGTNSLSNPSSYTIEDSVTFQTPSKAGYTFKGWYSDSNFNTKITTISNQTGNVTLYAKWEANSYNLTVNANEGAFAPKVTFVSDGVEIKKCYLYEQDTLSAYRPANKDGYIFAGWYKDASFNELFEFNGTITEDVILYAKWIECSDNVINIESADSFETTVAGRTEQLYAFVPLVDGTIVVTSSSDDLDLYGILYDATKNKLITADDISDSNLDFSYTYNVKAGQLYYIAVKGNTASTKGEATIDIQWTGDCTISGTTYQNEQATVVYDTNYKLPEKPIREGYVFLGWFDENDTRITAGIWNFTTDKSLTAKWEVATYHTVTFKDADGTIISTETYYLSEDIVAPELPIKDADHIYTYSPRWDNSYTGVCTGDAIYTVVFEPVYIDYTIVFKNWDGEVVATQTYHYGDTIIPPNSPTKDADNIYTYTFAGWDKEIVSCMGDTTYTATYTPSYIYYTVIFKDEESGEIYKEESLIYGSVITPPANPTKPSFGFDGWNGYSDNMTVSGDTVITAMWHVHVIAQESTKWVDSYSIKNSSSYPFTLISGWYASSNHDHNTTSVFEIHAIYDCTLKINYIVSSEPNCDKLIVLQNSTTKDTISGSLSEATMTLTLRAGDVVYIKYTKDRSNSYGSDKGWFKIVSCTQTEISDVTYIPTDNFNPTCTEAVVCDICNQTAKDALGHTNAAAVVENKVDATCTADGNYDSVVYCSVCNAELSREVKAIEKLGHDYETEWTEDVAPTCTTVGSKSHHCSRCDDKADVTEVPELEHSYGDWSSVDSTQHQRTCACGNTETKDHIFDEQGLCTFCNARQYTPGDVDGNESIDKNDAIYLLMHSFFPEDYPINQEADYNSNGIIDKDDAIHLLMYTFFPDDYPLAPAPAAVTITTTEDRKKENEE